MKFSSVTRLFNLNNLGYFRAIMKKRKRFEYKTQRRTKEKEVYLQYIQYEISVQQLVKLRREVRIWISFGFI